tara:strand:- start:165 stop:566 length:402 start_codon:yes stop_codon:yes gene_type:complete
VPRLPVDGNKVVEHRITFGTKERDMLEGYLAAYQFGRIATPIVNALSDVSFLLFTGGILAAYNYIDKETWDSLTAGIAQTASSAEEAAITIIEAGQQAYDVGQETRERLFDPLEAGPIPGNTLLGLARAFGLL